MPAGGTDFAVFFDKLSGLDNTQMLVDVAAEREVVDGLVLDDALFVDEKGGPHGDAFIGMLDAVGLGDLVFDVGNDGELDRANAAVFDGSFSPSMMREWRVNGNADDFHS